MRLEDSTQIKIALLRAERTRCACGRPGSWEHPVYGTVGDRDAVWAGCPNCEGTAVGSPILASDLAEYERTGGAFDERVIVLQQARWALGEIRDLHGRPAAWPRPHEITRYPFSGKECWRIPIKSQRGDRLGTVITSGDEARFAPVS